MKTVPDSNRDSNPVPSECESWSLTFSQTAPLYFLPTIWSLVYSVALFQLLRLYNVEWDGEMISGEYVGIWKVVILAYINVLPRRSHGDS
jgi:hypothetical protein